jgi:membrane associated rhomboid family serine protease
MAYRGSFSFGFGLTPWVKNLIIANVAIFFVDYMMGGRLGIYMAFVPGRILVEPWTLITYMFAHGGFWHVFLNMLVLFFFGPPLEQRWGSREFLKFYFICGLGGALLSFIFAPMSPIIGASAAVYGIMLAFAMYWPDSPIYIWGVLPVKAKYLVMFMAAVSIMSMFGSGRGDNIAHAAHLGGFAAGFLYLKLNGPGGPLGGFRKMMNKRKLKVVTYDDARTTPARAATSSSARRRPAGSAEEEKLLDELDRVLEKISTQGMSSLTPQERKLLDEVSRRYRTD